MLKVGVSVSVAGGGMKVVGDKVNTPQIRCYHSTYPRVTPSINSYFSSRFLCKFHKVHNVTAIDNNEDVMIGKMTMWVQEAELIGLLGE